MSSLSFFLIRNFLSWLLLFMSSMRPFCTQEQRSKKEQLVVKLAACSERVIQSATSTTAQRQGSAAAEKQLNKAGTSAQKQLTKRTIRRNRLICCNKGCIALMLGCCHPKLVQNEQETAPAHHPQCSLPHLSSHIGRHTSRPNTLCHLTLVITHFGTAPTVFSVRLASSSTCFDCPCSSPPIFCGMGAGMDMAAIMGMGLWEQA